MRRQMHANALRYCRRKIKERLVHWILKMSKDRDEDEAWHEKARIDRALGFCPCKEKYGVSCTACAYKAIVRR